MNSCIPTGDGRDITPEDDEHIAWFNLGLRTARAKAKRESKCPQCGISNGTCSCYLVRETGQYLHVHEPCKECKVLCLICDKCKHNPSYTLTTGGTGQAFDGLDRYNAKPIQPTDQSKDINLECQWPGHPNNIKCLERHIPPILPLPQPNTDSLESELRELLADQEHATWASWQKWLHDEYQEPNGDVLLPYSRVQYWDRQIQTPYADLSEPEKNSDRREVDKVLPAVIQLFNKYARDAVITELMAIMNRHDDIEVKGGIPVPLLMVANRIAELKEQRAKLKEEGSHE